MPMGGMAMMPSAGGAANAEAEPEVVSQTSFTVKLSAFDDKKKIALIKEIKASVEGLNLVQVR